MEPMTLPNERIDTLQDAMRYALAMSDAAKLFGAPPASALWIGTDRDEPNYSSMFVALPIPDPTSFVSVVDALDGVTEMVLWRYSEDPTSDDETAAFFSHRDELEGQGVTLLDEILVSLDGEILTSLAVRTFADRGGWDDLTDAYNAAEEGQ